MLKAQESRVRQHRLLKELQKLQLDAAVIALPHHVYYLSAFKPFWLHESALVLFADGRSWLATANQPARDVAADEVVAFEANWMGTQRQEQPAILGDLIAQLLIARHCGRIGYDASAVSSQVAIVFEGDREPIDAALWQMRRRKDADELELLKKAIDCSGAMYERARAIVEPGLPEVELFAELQKAAVLAADEAPGALCGNDFRYDSAGGPPRAGRVARAGEICQLDLGPAYRGYFADNARCLCVDRKPTEAQLRIWEVVADALKVVERLAKPGVRGRDVFHAVDQHFQQALGRPLGHHLGHGIGLQPHEFPHLNLKWDDALIEGEVFTAEPGIYLPETRGGIRLENDYLVTARGVVNLSDFPLEL